MKPTKLNIFFNHSRASPTKQTNFQSFFSHNTFANSNSRHLFTFSNFFRTKYEKTSFFQSQPLFAPSTKQIIQKRDVYRGSRKPLTLSKEDPTKDSSHFIWSAKQELANEMGPVKLIRMSDGLIEYYRKLIIQRKQHQIISDILNKGGQVDKSCGFLMHKLMRSDHVFEAYLMLKHLFETQSGVGVEVPIVVSVISGLISISKFQLAEEIMNFSKHLIENTLIGFSLYIKYYCRMGNFDKANEVLKKMADESDIEPNLIMYSAIVEAYAQFGKVDECLLVIDTVKSKGIPLNIYILNSLAYGYINAGQYDNFFKLFEEIENGTYEGVLPDVATINIVIQTYFKLEMFERVKTFFNESKEKYPNVFDNTVYNLLINEYYQRNMIDDASEVITELLGTNLPIDRATFVPIIKDCVEKKNMTSAESTFNYMMSLGIKPSVTMLNTLIWGYFHVGAVDKATQTYFLFYEEGLKPEKSDYPKLLTDLVIKPGYFGSYSEYFLNLAKNPDMGKKLGYTVFNILIVGFWKHLSQPRVALSLYQKMLDYNIPPNGMTYSLLISIFVETSEYRQAADSFERLKLTKNHALSPKTLEEMLLAFAEENDMPNFEDTLERLKKTDWKIQNWLVGRVSAALQANNNEHHLNLWRSYTERPPPFVKKGKVIIST